MLRNVGERLDLNVGHTDTIMQCDKVDQTSIQLSTLHLHNVHRQEGLGIWLVSVKVSTSIHSISYPGIFRREASAFHQGAQIVAHSVVLIKYITMNDIPIRYTNATGKADFQVVVFYPVNLLPVRPSFVAWKVLTVQPGSEVEFIYPKDNSVGFYYKDGDQKIQSAILPAMPGSVWIITTDSSGILEISPQCK